MGWTARFLTVIIFASLAVPNMVNAQALPDNVRNAGVTISEWRDVQNAVQRLSAAQDVSQKALAAVAEHLGVALAHRRQVGVSQLLELIDAQARRLKSVGDALASAEQTDTTVSTVDLSKARAALDEGDLNTAVAILHAMRHEGDAGLAHAQSQDAEVIALEAQVEVLRFNYVRAASLYGQAAEVTPPSNQYTRWAYRYQQAQTLYDFSELFGDSKALHETILLYTDLALPLAPPMTDQWAYTENGIGLSWLLLSELGDSNGLQQASVAFSAALAYFSTKFDIENWMRSQNNLANTLRKLGEDGDTTAMQEAIEAYHRLADVSQQLGNQMMWAAAQNGLANALGFKGEHGNVGALWDRVTTLRDALNVTDRSSNPDEWAAIQNNLGNALMDLSDKGYSSMIELAIAAYQSALEVESYAHSPVDWARVQGNLASAFEAKARYGLGRDNYRTAIDCYRNALTVFTPQNAPVYYRTYANGLIRVENELSASN